MIFVLIRADPTQENTLNERQGQEILWLSLGNDIWLFGAKCFTEEKGLIYLFLHLYIFISKYGFFMNYDTHYQPEQLLWLIYCIYICRSHRALWSAFAAFSMCSCKWECRRGQCWGVCVQHRLLESKNWKWARGKQQCSALHTLMANVQFQGFMSDFKILHMHPCKSFENLQQ